MENIFQRVGYALLERTGYHLVRHDVLEDLIDTHEQEVDVLKEDIKLRQTMHEDLQGQCDRVTTEKNNLHVQLVELSKQLETMNLLVQASQHSNNIETGLQLIEDMPVTPVKKPRGKKVTAQTNGN